MAELSDRKQKDRGMWASGDYPSIADHLGEMGRTTVERAGAKDGAEVLDVAAGAGNASILAAEGGAKVTGLDLVPELLEAAQGAAEKAGVEVTWIEGDAEELPFEDESFDVVLSTVGIMFAPDHQAAAREAARVLRPGGRLGIASWTPAGGIGRFFKAVGSHMPKPPEGFQPPPLWGTAEHVTSLFEGTGVTLSFEEHAVVFDYDSAEEAVTAFETLYGPTIRAKGVLEPEGKWDALRSDLLKVFEEGMAATGGKGFTSEYLLALGKKS